jgi:hypothetical protein
MMTGSASHNFSGIGVSTQTEERIEECPYSLSARGLPLASNTRLCVRGVCCLILIICLLYTCIIFSDQFFRDVQKVCPFAFCWDNILQMFQEVIQFPPGNTLQGIWDPVCCTKISKEKFHLQDRWRRDWSIRMMGHFTDFYIELFRQVSATTSASFDEHKPTSEFFYGFPAASTEQLNKSEDEYFDHF